MEFARAIEAKLKERNRGATTHCQCAACKNGNIHDSDCSVHNGDALPVGPCDCSLATPPMYQPAANEAVEILMSLGYVYEPSKTGLAWVTKKSAQRPWQGLDEDEIRELYGKDLNYRDGNYVRYAKSVEAQLKERNGY
jgi:type V secretory pathway adhesin AidA